MGGLSFLYPGFLIGAAAIALPVILHLLKREQAPALPFSAVRFLRRAPVEQKRRKKLRELLLLALRVAALALLAVAFARPYFGSAAAASASVLIVAVDTSFSMSAPGRFSRAQQLAREAIGRAGTAEPVGLISFNDAADVLVEPSLERGVVLRRIADLAPGYGTTRYRVALSRAASLIGARPGRIIVVTDLQRAGWDSEDPGSLPERISIEIADVGATEGNLAVGAIRQQGSETVATILRSGVTLPQARSWLSVDDRRVAEATVALGEGAYAEARFPFTLPQSGMASVSIEDRAGYSADNTRYVILDPAAPVPVLIIGGIPNRFYVDHALRATEELSRFDVRTQTGAELPPTDREQLRRYGMILLLSTRGLEERRIDLLASYLSDGGGLLVAAGPDVEPTIISSIVGGVSTFALPELGRESGDGVTFTPSDPRHPIFRELGVLAGRFGQARFRRTVRIEERQPIEVLARFSDGRPALVESPVGRGLVLLFASDLENRWNDFPLHPSFVPFVHQAVRHLIRKQEAAREYLIADAPRGVPLRPGVAVIDRPPRSVAINVDTRESNPARLTPADFKSAMARISLTVASEVALDAQQRERRQSYWRYGLMLMLVALAAESMIGRRVG